MRRQTVIQLLVKIIRQVTQFGTPTIRAALLTKGPLSSAKRTAQTDMGYSPSLFPRPTSPSQKIKGEKNKGEDFSLGKGSIFPLYNSATQLK